MSRDRDTSSQKDPASGAGGRDGRVHRVVNVLDVVCRVGGAAPTFQEIVSATELPKATVFRLVEDLEATGVIYRFRRRYYAGYRFLAWASGVSELEVLATRAQPELVRLRDDLAETVSLMHMAGDRRVCLLAVEGTKAIRHVLHAGEDFPLFSGASGHVLLSNLPEEEMRRLWERTPEFRAATRSDADWQQVVERVESERTQGWAVSLGERDANLAAVAVPVMLRSFHMAISVSGPRGEFSKGAIPVLVAAARAAAARIADITAEEIRTNG